MNPLRRPKKYSYSPTTSVMANYKKKKQIKERKICDVMSFFTHGEMGVAKSKKKRGELSISDPIPLNSDVKFITSSILGKSFALNEDLQHTMEELINDYVSRCSHISNDRDIQFLIKNMNKVYVNYYKDLITNVEEKIRITQTVSDDTLTEANRLISGMHNMRTIQNKSSKLYKDETKLMIEFEDNNIAPLFEKIKEFQKEIIRLQVVNKENEKIKTSADNIFKLVTYPKGSSIGKSIMTGLSETTVDKNATKVFVYKPNQYNILKDYFENVINHESKSSKSFESHPIHIRIETLINYYCDKVNPQRIVIFDFTCNDFVVKNQDLMHIKGEFGNINTGLIRQKMLHTLDQKLSKRSFNVTKRTHNKLSLNINRPFNNGTRKAAPPETPLTRLHREQYIGLKQAAQNENPPLKGVIKLKPGYSYPYN